jgi:mevalonate kinase
LKPLYKIKIPGKFFLSGEYAALRGMPTISVAVKPEFLFQSNLNQRFQFHPDSPAGLLNPHQLQGTLTDPYQGWGGMGLSTAEFVMNYVMTNQEQKIETLTVWQAYRKLLANNGNVPSGVDLITQLEGGYVTTQMSSQLIAKQTWGFQNLGWCLALTGNKLKTHEHLKSDLSDLNWSEVDAINSEIDLSFKNNRENEFIKPLKGWRDLLQKSRLETSLTTELIAQIQKDKNVIFAKGCGAMGSDAIWILFDSNEQSSVIDKLKYIFKEKSFFIYDSDVAYNGMTWENL